MEKHQDVVIVGAGPAGLSAATTLASHGLGVLVLDEQPGPGGQIYRNIERAGDNTCSILGTDYDRGRELIAPFRAGNARYLESAIVWRMDPDGRLCFSRKGRAVEIQARHIVIATGAMERPVPFPGWTLPGVMGAGAVDANLKSSATLPRGPVVLAGSGPLLLSTAGYLSTLKVAVAAILDTTPAGNTLTALPLLPRAMRRMDYLFKGLKMILDLQRSGTRYIRGVTRYAAHGSDRVDSVSCDTKNGSVTFGAAALLVHEGIVPRCDFTRQLELSHQWDSMQRFWYPRTTVCGRTDQPAIYVAGDGAFVHGGISAACKGVLAGLDIAARQGALPEKEKIRAMTGIRKALRRELAPRPFVDALYAPRSDLYAMDDDTLVCRCESVTAGMIREAVDQGCRDPNEIKAMTRCGMGPCQGRMCGTALSEIIASHLHQAPASLIPLKIRPPVRNISLSQLAGLQLLEHGDQ